MTTEVRSHVTRCQRPYCGGSLLSMDDEQRCLSCGRAPATEVAPLDLPVTNKVPSAALLATLQAEPAPLTALELAEKHGVTRERIYCVLDSLRKRGLVESIPGIRGSRTRGQHTWRAL